MDEPRPGEQAVLDEPRRAPVGDRAPDAEAGHHVPGADRPDDSDPGHDRPVSVGDHTHLHSIIHTMARAAQHAREPPPRSPPPDLTDAKSPRDRRKQGLKRRGRDRSATQGTAHSRRLSLAVTNLRAPGASYSVAPCFAALGGRTQRDRCKERSGLLRFSAQVRRGHASGVELGAPGGALEHFYRLADGIQLLDAP